MTGVEFVELVDWVQDRWGSSDEVWANSSRFAEDFKAVPGEFVWVSMNQLAAQGPKWAPRPVEVLSGARRVWGREMADRGLPASTEQGRFTEWCVGVFGEVLPMAEVIRRRHVELEGMLVEESEARLPGETGLIADGLAPRVECRSAFCEVHRAVPLEGGL